MFKKIIDFINSKPDEKTNVENLGPTLAIKIGDVQIATLYNDGEYFCLVYKDKFKDFNINPFNPSDVTKDNPLKTDFLYKNKTLWHSFDIRLPDPERADYISALQKHSLKGDENPLIILGKLGSNSISKPWKLELVK